jgi:L-threonylcarbamoyladenylate synthase
VIAQLHASDPVDVGKAADLLAAGMVVAIPTDTVYGLAVDPSQPGAVDRVFALKKRPGEVALPVLVTGWGQVEMVAGTLEGAAQGFADQYWPGPLTLVVPRRGRFRADLGGELAASWTVGLRWPDHPVVQALCTAIGPLAVTSANRHAEPPATSAEDVIVAFTGDGRLSAVLDGGVCDGAPSTVVECRGPVSRCLREGAIRWDGPTRRPEALD